MKKQISKSRCAWVGEDLRMELYHDTVWGVPKRDDKEIFEAILLDTPAALLNTTVAVPPLTVTV